MQKLPEKGLEAISIKINNTLHSEFQTLKGPQFMSFQKVLLLASFLMY